MKYEEYINGFEKNHIGELKKETIAQYRKDIEVFIKWNRNRNIKEDSLEEYKEHLRKKGYQVSTINTKVASASKFCRYLKTIGVISKDIKYLAIKKQSKELTTIPNKTECKKMINRAMREGNYKDGCMMAIPLFTGVRVSELIKLKVKDFEKDKLPMDSFKVEGKGQKEREIGIPSQLYYTYIKPYLLDSKLKPNDYLFTKRGSKAHISRQRVNQVYKRYASKTKVNHDKATPHQFRHAYAIMLLEGSQNIETVRQMLGHSTINTTAVYLNQSRQDQYREIEKAFGDF